MGATMKVLLAARLAATGAYKATSSSSPQAHVARLTAVSPLTARAQIETGEQLGTLDATLRRHAAVSCRSGRSRRSSAAASIDPTAEDELLESASHLTLGQLRHRCAEVIDAADDDPEATAQAPAPRPGGAPVPHTRWVQPPPCAIVARGPR